VTQRDQALFGLVWFELWLVAACVRCLQAARSRGSDGDEGAVGGSEQLSRQRNGARQAIVKGAHRRAEVERDDGGAARRPRVVARIGEAGGRLEQHLELEQRFVSTLEPELRQPGFALRPLLAV